MQSGFLKVFRTTSHIQNVLIKKSTTDTYFSKTGLFIYFGVH